MKKLPKINIIAIIVLALGLMITFAACEYEIVKINNSYFVLKLADSLKEKQQGLSGKSGLCERCGMLFVFDERGSYEFVMREMEFSLDFVWLKDNEVIGFEENIPGDYSDKISSSGDSDGVIEFNEGIVQRYNIQKGDKIDF